MSGASNPPPKPPSADDNAFKKELVTLIPHLRAFARTLTGDPTAADDLAQDAMMKAWDARASYQMGTNMKAWLFTILRNELYSKLRKRGREVQDSDGLLTENLAQHPAQYGALDMKDFQHALAQLPDEQREAIVLVGASGLSYEEAAEISGCALGTIKSRVNRARHKLQEILQITDEGEYGPDAISAPLTSRAFVS